MRIQKLLVSSLERGQIVVIEDYHKSRLFITGR